MKFVLVICFQAAGLAPWPEQFPIEFDTLAQCEAQNREAQAAFGTDDPAHPGLPVMTHGVCARGTTASRGPGASEAP
jgi:hypothetical protein